jgi:hypothetical protein
MGEAGVSRVPVGAATSNLSDSQFDYDLVVATTQKSINSGMRAFLDEVDSKEVIVCFQVKNHKWVQISHEELKSLAEGSDPFQVAHGADAETTPDLCNLKAAHFAGGFKAQIGMPDMECPQDIQVVTLKSGMEPVSFNLLCREFRIVGFVYDGDGATWVNQAQPKSIARGESPWYFAAQTAALRLARLELPGSAPHNFSSTRDGVRSPSACKRAWP